MAKPKEFFDKLEERNQVQRADPAISELLEATNIEAYFKDSERATNYFQDLLDQHPEAYPDVSGENPVQSLRELDEAQAHYRRWLQNQEPETYGLLEITEWEKEFEDIFEASSYFREWADDEEISERLEDNFPTVIGGTSAEKENGIIETLAYITPHEQIIESYLGPLLQDFTSFEHDYR